MALNHEKFEVTITFRDSGLDITRKTYELRGATMADALANAAAFVPVIAAASDAAVDGYQVSEVFAESAPAAIADDTVRNSNQAVISVQLATSPLKRGTIVVPAPKNALFTAVTGVGSDVIANNAALVTGLVSEFNSTGNVYISDGEDVSATPNISGYRRTVYRKLA